MMKILKSKIFILVLISAVSLTGLMRVFANEPKAGEHASEAPAEEHKSAGHDAEKFNAGTFIMHHIMDAHEWHILETGDFKLVVPLPVIIFSEGNFDFFLFNKFKGAAHGAKFTEDGRYKYENGKISATDGRSIVDLSITKNVVELFLGCIILCILFISVARAYARRRNQAPKGLQSFMEPLILFVRDEVAMPALGEKRAARYLPYLLTLFFFIFFNNLFGLVPFFPGGANLTGNIAVTMVLALFTFFITTFSANKSYWLHIINTPGVPWWLKIPIPLMPVVEIIGIFTKPFVLMVRLFANITAGHIIALGFFSLIFIFGEMNAGVGYGVSVVSVAFTIFMTILELLVAFLQAYVFALLSAIYFGMATEEHHSTSEHH